MTVKRAESKSYYSQQTALLAALSDDLTLPLVQLKTSLEAAGNLTQLHPKLTKSMSLSIETGLQLIEAYKLALRIQDESSMSLEPVAVGAVLNDVANDLSSYAQQYSTTLQVNIKGRLKPVLADRQNLATAMSCLAASLIRAQAAASSKKKHLLMFGAHKQDDGIIAAGVFSDIAGLSDLALRNARALAGRARQPIPALPAGTASGVLIADVLCGAMWQPLRAAAHKNLQGLATTVPASKQMQFI